MRAAFDVVLRGPDGETLPARVWRDRGRLTVRLGLHRAPDPSSDLVWALHTGLVDRRMVLDVVHEDRVVLTLGADDRLASV